MPQQLSFCDDSGENPAYLSTQLITYLGNKRALLGFIGQAVEEIKHRTEQRKLSIADMFSGSGVVSRFFKQSARNLFVNDYERYAHTVSMCYIPDAPDEVRLLSLHKQLINDIEHHLHRGFIAEMYAPLDEHDIKPGERCFFTPRNACYIDTARQLIETMPDDTRHFFIAPLLSEVSIKNNTSGVFKGFYKDSRTGVGQYGGAGRNALSRIKADIELPYPVFSNYSCPTYIYCMDANALAGNLPPVDLAYIDPPYNQHPYGSNYFMLNLVNDYIRPTNVSTVSGIPTDWQRSAYNKPHSAMNALSDLCRNIDARFLLISFNSDGFVTKQDMIAMLTDIGTVETLEQQYNTYRGSRNLNLRDIHVKEYLFLVEKRGNQRIYQSV